jgi:hypothetical protein
MTASERFLRVVTVLVRADIAAGITLTVALLAILWLRG